MTRTDNLQIRYVNMFEERLIPFSWLIKIWDSKEIFFLFRPSNEAHVLKYNEWELYNWLDFRDRWKMLYPIPTFLWLKIWLTDIINAEEWIIYEFNWFSDLDWISISYQKFGNKTWKIRVEFDDHLVWSMDDEYYSENPIEWTIYKFDFINKIYGWLVDYIADNFNWEERFEDVKWYSEPIYETLFSYDIDKYLKENWVDDIDERVQKAKNRIRYEWNNIFNESDRLYKENHDPYWHTFDHLL